MNYDKSMIEKKMTDSVSVVKKAFTDYNPDDLAIAFTGGKDSTLVLHAVYLACKDLNIRIPKCFNIDEGDMFDEIRSFISEIEKKYACKVEHIHNHDVSKAAGNKLGAMVKVSDLNDINQSEVERLGYEEDEFPYEPESFVGNHLMKTVTLNQYLIKNRIKGFFEGIRWDEQKSRANEKYFSPRAQTLYNPAHMRICPILHFTERDVWGAIFHYNIPICKLYTEGYRSLGARITTSRTSDIPAWEQDLENTYERGGRRQDKEGLMQKLRDLGYM